MAYDEALAERIRTALGKSREVAEKRIVGGGLGFMRDGKMFVGVMKDDLLVRVEPERRAALLKQTGVRSLRLGGKPTAAYVLIDPAAIGGRAALRTWIELAATSVTTTSQRGAKAKRRKGTIAAAEPDPRIAKLVEVFRADPKLRAVRDVRCKQRLQATAEVRIKRAQGGRQAVCAVHAGNAGRETPQGACRCPRRKGRWQTVRPGSRAADEGMADSRESEALVERAGEGGACFCGDRITLMADPRASGPCAGSHLCSTATASGAHAPCSRGRRRRNAVRDRPPRARPRRSAS
jgi:TfoX/Sxy family transcriptional regulator of competence genes